MGVSMVATNREDIAVTGVIPEGLQLLRDSIPLEIKGKEKVLTESISGKKVPALKLTGIFQRANQKNANGRIYPQDVLREAVESMQDAVKNRRVMGEFDHPPDAKIHMERVSHLITKLWMDGPTVWGELEVINDDRCPYGAQMACFIDRGIQIGISSRGVGDMEMTLEEGEEAYKVQEGFAFVTFDSVAEPSVQGTQLKRLNESVERLKNPDRKELRRIREFLLAQEMGRFFV
jgi:hypothetical protein